MLKKVYSAITLSIVALITMLVTPLLVSAGSLCPNNANGANFSVVCNLDLKGNVFGNVITIIFIVAIILALVYLIWGGIKWVLSGGDKAKVDAARAAIVAAIVGLVIVFLAFFIVNIVVPIFVPGFSLQNISLPSLNGDGGNHSMDSLECSRAGGTWNSSTNLCN